MPLSTVLGAQSLIKPGVCTTATRPASPYEGQAIYDTTVSQTLVWNGSAWVVQTGGLVYITSGTLSGVAAKNVDSVFTATYSNYVLMINNASVTTAGDMFFDLGMRSGGTTNSTSNYIWSAIINAYTTSVSAGANSSDTAYAIGGISGAAEIATCIVQISSPQLTTTTNFHSSYAYGPNAGIYMGYFNATTSFDGFSIISNGANFDNGTYKLYGYSNS